MTYERGNPEVKKWMKEHGDVVKRVQGRYDELRGLSTYELLEMATVMGADLTKVKDRLIVGIITKEAE